VVRRAGLTAAIASFPIVAGAIAVGLLDAGRLLDPEGEVALGRAIIVDARATDIHGRRRCAVPGPPRIGIAIIPVGI
jgi:hypothetical protein